MAKVRVGTDVQVRVDPRQNKGLDVAAGIVTRVNDPEDEPQTVNVRVFLDTGMDFRLTDIQLLDKEPDAEDNDVLRDASGTQQAAWFPPRR